VTLPGSDFEIVYVPVRKDLFEEVQAYVVGLTAKATGDPLPEPRADVRAAGTHEGPPTAPGEWDTPAGDWDEPLLRDLVSNAPDKQVAVLEAIATRAGENVSASEVQAHLAEKRLAHARYPGRAMGAVLAAMGKRCAWYDGRKPPFEAKWNSGLGNHYRMSEDFAAVVLDEIAQRAGREAASSEA